MCMRASRGHHALRRPGQDTRQSQPSSTQYVALDVLRRPSCRGLCGSPPTLNALRDNIINPSVLDTYLTRLRGSSNVM